jgi:hypothetical protein
MRRLLRWTFHALAAASLLLCVATAALWVRSHWVADEFMMGRRYDRRFDAESRNGQLFGLVEWYVLPEPDPSVRWELNLELRHENDEDPAQSVRSPDEGLLAGFGFRAVHADLRYRREKRFWHFPHWSLVAAFAVLPAIFVVRQRRAVRLRRRSRLGLCPACGYDLRATPGRCPECGREGR